MKVEGSGGGALPINRRWREAAAAGGGVSVRRRRTRWRVQADASPPLLRQLLTACRVAFRGPAGTVPAPADVSLVKGILAMRLARLVLDADLRASCDALVLYPESGGNMHRFTAATPCAVLDVLGPPYSRDRDCSYYQDFPYYSSNHDPPPDEIEAAAGDVDATTDDEKKKRQACRRLSWLKETDKPQNLKMYELPYKGPAIF